MADDLMPAQFGHGRFSLHFSLHSAENQMRTNYSWVGHPVWKVNMVDHLEKETNQLCNCRFRAIFKKPSVAILARVFRL
jgi:hypothetical protein